MEVWRAHGALPLAGGAVSRYRRRPSGHKDANHEAIVLELRQLGATVLETHALGDDAPDLVVGYRGITALVELKSGDRVLGRAHVTQRRKRERLERQRAYLDAWAGGLAFIAETTEAILFALVDATAPMQRSVPVPDAAPVSSWSPHALLLRPGAASTAPPAPPAAPRMPRRVIGAAEPIAATSASALERQEL
jgi:hypothetical protein